MSRFAKRRLVALARDTSGAVAMEFALIAGALFMLVVGTFEVGRILHERAAVDRALSEAVRALHLDPDMTGAQIMDRVLSLLDETKRVEVCIRPLSGTSIAEIRIQYPVEVAIPMLPRWNMTLTASNLAPRIKEEEDLLDTCGAQAGS